MSAKERSRVFDGDQEGGQRNSVGDDGGGAVADGGPGLAYMPFVVMEDLLDKLKLLNYEEVIMFRCTKPNNSNKINFPKFYFFLIM